MVSFTLDDGEQINAEAPDTFLIPSRIDRENLVADALVKLIFRIETDDDFQVERMWVIVKEKTPEGYIGILDNEAYCTDEIGVGLEIEFKPEHVIQIYHDDKKS